MKETTPKEIEKIIKKGLKSLTKSLGAHYPERTDFDVNEISESNLTIHLAHAFISDGYVSFGEFPFDNNKHLDLVCFHENREPWVAIEAKRYINGNTKAVYEDFRRILKQGKYEDSSDGRNIGVSIMFNRHKDIDTWWKDPLKENLPKGKSSEYWQNLIGVLDKYNPLTGVHVLFEDEYEESEEWGNSVLYAIFRGV